jgi:hypothetical protein
MKKSSTSLATKEMQIKTTLRTYHPNQNGYRQETTTRLEVCSSINVPA